MSKTVISVENLSKSYRLGQIGTGTLTNDLNVWWAKVRGKPNPMLKIGQADYGNRDGETLWALRDVSFKVEQGEVLGIIGRNGAGKSTLLKILSRVTAPTSGCVKVKGRIASLLEVGTGFHPELTGRENIYLNGAILGMTKQEVTRKFDEIVAFAEVEKFIDTPVKRYSSGMYVRLAFAVAAHLESEILLVDEVLAVGDAEFQKKCLGKMGNVASQEGRTVLFVSHNMGAVRSLCIRGVLLERGRIISNDLITTVVDNYFGLESKESEISGIKVWNLGEIPETDDIALQSIKLVGPNSVPQSTIDVTKGVRVEINYQVKKPIHGLRINLYVLTFQGEVAFVTTDHNLRNDVTKPGLYISTCIFPGGLFNIGKYVLDVHIDIPGVVRLVKSGRCLTFTTIGEGNQGSNYPEKWPGVLCPKLDWKIQYQTINDRQNIS